MKKLLLAFALATLCLTTPAFAQPAEFTLKVTNDDVNMIGKSLGKLPFDEVAGLIQKLRTQITEQSQPKQEAPAPKVEAPKPEEKK